MADKAKYIFVTGGVVSALGKGIREFKGSVREIEGELKGPLEDDTRSVPPRRREEEEEGPRRLKVDEEESGG